RGRECNLVDERHEKAAHDIDDEGAVREPRAKDSSRPEAHQVTRQRPESPRETNQKCLSHCSSHQSHFAGGRALGGISEGRSGSKGSSHSWARGGTVATGGNLVCRIRKAIHRVSSLVRATPM